MYSAKLYYDKRKRSNQGYPVKVMVYDSGSKKQHPISIRIYQTGAKLRVTHELAKTLDQYQERISFCNQHRLEAKEALKIIREGHRGEQELEIEVLERRLKALKKEKQIDLFQFGSQFIEEKKLQGKSARHFKEALSAFRLFTGTEPFWINNLTYEALNGYVQFKRRTAKGSSPESSISKTLRSLRTIYKEAQRRESLHVKNDNPFSILRTLNIQPKKAKVWRTEEIRQLFNFEPKPSTSNTSKENMRWVIDCFLFQFAIGGHDLIDVAGLKWSNIKDGRIRFQRIKNRNRPGGGPWIDNKLNIFALQFIEKYGDRESDRIFSRLADPLSDRYRRQNQYHLKTLERVSKTLGIDKLGTKTPRYIFRTWGGELLVNDLILMNLMGHTSQSVTHSYQNSLANDIKDGEHEKILDLLF